MPVVSRSMTPAEKYYTFLDMTWPMNIMIVADLDIAFPIGQVAETWTQFCELRSWPRLTAQADLTLVDIGSDRIEFTGTELPSDQWHAQMDLEARASYGLDVPLRCRYYVSPEEHRSRVALVGHHAIVDGRVGVANLQSFLRGLDGQPIEEQQGISIPARSIRPEGYPWQADNRRLIQTLREISNENSNTSPVDPADWPDVSLDRSPRTAPVIFDVDESARLLLGMKSQGIRPLPAMGAAWLSAVRQLLVGEGSATLQLGTAVDLAMPHTATDRPPAMTIGVVANRFRVENQSPWVLARDIATSVAASMDRGDGDLFFHLARVDSIDDLEAGTRVVARSLEGTAPTVSVTNLGVVDPGSDPAWIRWMCGYLAPTPNQIAFVSGLGYRGQLINSTTTDDTRVPPGLASALVDRFKSLTGELALTP